MSFVPPKSRSLANLFLISITAFGILSALALAAARLEHLQPDATVFPPVVFGQLMGIHRVLLKYFVLLPALTGIVGFAMLPGLCGRERLAFPRLGLTAWALFTTGGLMVLWASLGAAVDPKWALYAGHPVASQPGSLMFLTGLVMATLAIGLVALNLLVSIQTATANTSPTLSICLSGTCALQLMALPLVGSALMISIGTGLGILHVPGIGDDGCLFALLASLAARPLKMSVLLAAMGIAAQLLGRRMPLTGRQVKRTRIYVIGLVILALLAFDTRLAPSTMATQALIAASNVALASAPRANGLIIGRSMPDWR